ncbi:hypothetical protein GCM10015535_28030 [Streptomyces gelaticus]|uniref:Uncharacterized protein n=1 Tax=Streptomyces gelaticus TaxID=285446 RepID=A0ABQ2W0V9_9ACTN|nr:hypothetical protein GCM10015535_28030 [Streptomyces gelaticus]
MVQAGKARPRHPGGNRSRTGPSGGSNSCAARGALHQLRATALSLPNKSVSVLAGKTDGFIRYGEYACGISQFEAKRFDSARLMLTEFAATYKRGRRRARARARARHRDTSLVAMELRASGDRVEDPRDLLGRREGCEPAG